MIFCDTGCSGVMRTRDGRVSSSLLRLTEEPESEGIMVGRGAWGVGCGAGGLAMTGDLLGTPSGLRQPSGVLRIPWPRNRELLRIRRVILSMVTAVKWLADGYWRERCVRHVPDSVRAFLTALELPGFIEVRVVDEAAFSCPACWAERMTGR